MELNLPLLAVFVFALGACVGSFLNVVVYRMPRDLSLSYPPSACPKCGHRLAWYDNVPVFGWLWLRGRCRYCGEPISPRYPLVELATGLLFLGQFYLLFFAGWGPYEVREVPTVFGTFQTSFRLLTLERDWPVLLLHAWLIATLLSASLIDLEHYIIPLEMCWLLAAVGVVTHALGRPPGSLGSLHFGPVVDAVALAGAVGIGLSIGLVRLGWLRRSFAEDAPLLEKDVAVLPEDERPDPWTASRIRAEMRREMLFLLPALLLAVAAGVVVLKVPAAEAWWAGVSGQWQFSGALGALCGGLVGAGVVWLFRIGGSYGFGREAMGLGDVHLMLGIGCVLGPGAATAAFFLAPGAGLIVAAIQLLRRGTREIPYGPYLSLAAYAMALFYTPVYNYFGAGLVGLSPGGAYTSPAGPVFTAPQTPNPFAPTPSRVPPTTGP